MEQQGTSKGSLPIATILSEGNARIELAPDKNLLSLMQAHGLYVPAICGGRGICGKCKVKVVSGTVEISPADRKYFSAEELAQGYRLSCLAFPQGDIGIEIPKSGEQAFQALDSFDASGSPIRGLSLETFSLENKGESMARQTSGLLPLSLKALHQVSKLVDLQGERFSISDTAPSQRDAASEEIPSEEPLYLYRDGESLVHIREGLGDIYAIGIDIGTTTIAMALVNLQTGEVRGRYSVVNKQREFGADVISRIQRANGGELDALGRSVRRQISEGVAALCKTHAIQHDGIVKIAIAGNTTMLHLLLGLSCRMLGQKPFTPVTLDFVTVHYTELFQGDFACDVILLPGISTYVGADITAGILYADVLDSKEPVFFMDIGTNGEMAVVIDGKILCTATAAGPAFEGGNILWGTGSVPGAISSATYFNGVFTVKTIENGIPMGICGSGVVEIVHEGLKNGLILSSGSYNADKGIEEMLIAKTGDGRDIVFCQKDVRELQLAKSAIRSGMDALIKACSLEYDAVKALYIAGGFGYNLNFDSGVGIGLIPEELKPKVQLIGNSSLGGTIKYLLNRDYQDLLNTIMEDAQEYSLPEDPYFSERFIENIEFEGFD